MLVISAEKWIANAYTFHSRPGRTFVLGVLSLSSVILQWRLCGRSSRGDFFSQYFQVCQKACTFLFVCPVIARLLLRGKESVCQVKCVEVLHGTRALVALGKKDSERLVASAGITNCNQLYVYMAQMTRDFAADLSDFFWHVTWDLSFNFAIVLSRTHDMGVMRRHNGQVFFHFLTDDMGIFDQIIIRILGLPGPRWEVAGNEMGRRIYHRRWDV